MEYTVKSLVIYMLAILTTVHSSWWYLGLSGAHTQTKEEQTYFTKSQADCDNLTFLASGQKKLCRKESRLIEVISKGAAEGIAECQHQFLDSRWNCSIFNTSSIFGNVVQIKSKETAFIYAIFSAGIMHSITRACSRGTLNSCGCDLKIRRRETFNQFQWGGCSENVRFSNRFTRDFVDNNERRNSESGLMNLWNNEAGRRAIKNNMELVCKCHGVSGSCSAKICFRKMRSFRDIGHHLKNKFSRAAKVKLHRRKRKLKPIYRFAKATKRDLVYLKESPDFCEYNIQHGSLGTHGRKCNVSSSSNGGCTRMCCGRGYYTLVQSIVEDCECKFFWCCRVKCKKCKHIQEQQYCN